MKVFKSSTLKSALTCTLMRPPLESLVHLDLLCSLSINMASQALFKAVIQYVI